MTFALLSSSDIQVAGKAIISAALLPPFSDVAGGRAVAVGELQADLRVISGR